METQQSFSVNEIQNDNFLITFDNKKINITLKLTENSINIMIKKYLIMTNFEGIFLMDDLLKINNIFVICESLENIFKLLKKKIVDKNFEILDEDSQIKLIFFLSFESISVKVPFIIKRSCELNTEKVFDEMLNVIFLLDEKVEKLEKLVGHLQFYDDSQIIKKGEMEKIKNWIDQENDLQTKLIYRLSKDGDKAADFHSKCDGKGPTLVLIENTIGKRFGGFTNLKWNSSESYITNDDLKSFIFSLDNMTKFACTDQNNIIYGGINQGPTFGGGHDLYINDKCSSSDDNYCKFPFSYGNGQIPDKSFFYITGSYNFRVKEIEVYLVE
jgi:hypothetical protein